MCVSGQPLSRCAPMRRRRRRRAPPTLTRLVLRLGAQPLKQRVAVERLRHGCRARSSLLAACVVAERRKGGRRERLFWEGERGEQERPLLAARAPARRPASSRRDLARAPSRLSTGGAAPSSDCGRGGGRERGSAGRGGEGAQGRAQRTSLCLWSAGFGCELLCVCFVVTVSLSLRVGAAFWRRARGKQKRNEGWCERERG